MKTRDSVLAALRGADDKGVSGEWLASSLGVSRVAVSKHVSTLRGLGYVIEASPATGYRLIASPDLALPTQVSPLLNDPFWCAIEGGAVTASTHDDAVALARAGAEEGTLIVAGAQSGGRGRLGRQWRSPEGGVYASFVLRPVVAPAQAGSLSLAVALGIARGLDSLGVECRVKWPNDVWVGGDKLAGVLLEMSAEGDCVRWIVAGFGLNVRREGPVEPGVAYLADIIDVGVPEAAAAALDGVAGVYREWRLSGFSSLASEFRLRSVLTGESVVVSDAGGVVRASGIVHGVDEEGRLLVGGEESTQAVVAGEVTLRR